MPVSPADFEFYSRMTGQPIPNTPAGRMAIAPQVYNMRRGGGGFGRFVRGAAQGALAAGALVGAGALLSSMEDDKLAAESEKKAGEEAKKAAAATESRRVEDMRSGFSRQLPSRGMRARASAEAEAQAEASRVAEMRGDASRQLPSSAMIAARQQPSPDLTARATSFIEELQAQGAKEREATATARAIQEEDSRAYRAMVRDRAEKLIQEIQSGAQADVPAFRRSAEGSMDIDASTFDDPNVLIGQPDASQRAKVEAFLKNRASLQTSVPQADVNVANESTAAQRASVSAPMDPTPVVRQQPSSGQVVSDVSNVAQIDSGSRMPEKKSRMAGSVFTTDVSGSEMVKSFALNPENPEYMGLNYVKTPGKTYDYSVTPTFGRALMSQMDRLSDPKQRELEQSEGESMGKMIDDMKKRGSIVREGQSAPELFTTPQVRSSFVTDGGKKVEGVMNRVANQKRQRRESELRDALRKGGAGLSPEEQEQAIQKMLTDEGF